MCRLILIDAHGAVSKALAYLNETQVMLAKVIAEIDYTEINRVTQRLLQIVGCDIVMEIASKTVT